MTLLTVVDIEHGTIRREEYHSMMKFFLLLSILCLVCPSIDGISIKYRRWCSPWNFCSLSAWRPWSDCDKACGGGVRERYRQMCSLPVMNFTQHVSMCRRTFQDLVEYENCSQTCSDYGTWSNTTNQCVCLDEGIVDSCCTTGKRTELDFNEDVFV
jgi:hypothetical protein